jgi:predicted adenylyl cyclase CyaB
MACNVEIKLHLRNPTAVLSAAARLSHTGARVLEQVDVFFAVPSGRLKLRTIRDEHCELIAYHRADRPGPRTSVYEIVPVNDGPGLHRVLGAALGERVVVRKTRRLFLAGQTRIHVDDVEGLGTFLELEVVLRADQDATEGSEVLRGVLDRLGAEGEEVEGAYADLLMARGKSLGRRRSV